MKLSNKNSPVVKRLLRLKQKIVQQIIYFVAETYDVKEMMDAIYY